MSSRSRFLAFAAVGVSGVAVNALLMWLLHNIGVAYVAAAVAATQTAILWNMVLSEQYVFADRTDRTSFRTRLVQYFAVNNIDLLLRVPLMVLLVEAAGMRPSPANLVLIVGMSAAKYAVLDRLVYAVGRQPAPAVPVLLAADHG